METLLIILIVLLIAGFAAIFWFVNKKLSAPTDDKDKQSLVMLQNQINELNKVLDSRLGESYKAMQQQSYHSQKVIREVTEKLTKLDETNRQVKDFAGQMQSLENILKNPKQRGILGEYFLETVLKNVLPPSAYKLQYKFKDGEIVDAVIFIKEKIIPVDSKFSLENYNKIVEASDKSERERLEKSFKTDLKNRIDETSKYIRPNEGTMEFAFMFIPSEGIYYDLLINQVGAIKVNTRDLIEYAFKEKHVIIVSPTSFFAYLQTVLQGLRALQIEESAKEIRKNVEQLNKHILSYESFMQKLGNNLGTTVNMYNSAYKEFKKIDKDVSKITEGESKVDPLELQRPEQ